MEVTSHFIQHTDFSSSEGEPLTHEEASRLMRQPHWEEELAQCKPEDEAGETWCRPNFSIIAEDGSRFQVVFLPEGKAYFTYAFKEKWVSFLPFANTRFQSSPPMAREKMEKALRCFYAGEHGRLMEWG